MDAYSISAEKIQRFLGIHPKKNIRGAIVDLQKAFASGRVPDSSDTIYRNVDKMKEIGFGRKT